MKTSIAQMFKWTAASALAAFALTGCMTQATTDYTPDGGNAVISQESSNMGQVLNTQPTAKVGTSLSDTGDSVITRFHLMADSTCLPGPCFVRSSQFTTPNGKFNRERQDTIWLLDSNGAYLRVFHPFQATTIIHHRHVVKVNGSKDIDLQFNTTLTKGVDSSGAKVLVWNGTITGTLNGATINATISNVTRPILLGVCGLPEGGSIRMNRGDGVKLDIDFKGGGKAEVVVTGRNGKLHHASIDGDQETEKD